MLFLVIVTGRIGKHTEARGVRSWIEHLICSPALAVGSVQWGGQ